MDRTRPSAGKAAAVGLVLGVRFALGPKTITKSRRPALDVWEPGGAGQSGRARAIAEYRRCKNEQALDAIRDWRWER